FLHRRQFHEPREDRLRGDRVIDRAALYSQLAQHLAQRRADLRVAGAFVRRVRQNFAQSVTIQDEPAVGLGMEFSEPNGLRTEVQAENAGRGGHRMETPNPKSHTPSKSQTAALRAETGRA